MENKETTNNVLYRRKENSKQSSSKSLCCYDLDSDWDAQYDEIKKNYYEYIRRKNESKK